MTNPLLCLVMLFLCFSLCKSQLPIPAKIDGFVYKKPTVWGESVAVEAFLDPHCPDSRDSWLPLKQALDYYSGRLSLVVHPFPLPYHSNSFTACRSLHIANKLNSSSVYPLLELFFKTQEKYYNRPTYWIPRASIVADMTKLALTVVGESFSTAFHSGFNDSSTDQAARISFKYGCSRGVAGTPSFFVNGMPLSNSTVDYNTWKSIVDPLLSKNKN
ncbi:Thioredoxin superfamily protein [Rhynchospora pubera]|uniref:Thioredoxin superfamily protein n=1 Tax=Rhynchospora pubera TaxID=906938 RepID=A0AAV8G4L9_9POAL|nr:Thioredoxin superfamily protein [Rhynchospora pubera]